jgi:hypothetical protein
LTAARRLAAAVASIFVESGRGWRSLAEAKRVTKRKSTKRR